MSDIDIIMRLGLAVLIGGIIGFEREAQGRAAGLRTHILVCVGSALIALTSIYIALNYGGLNHNCDPARVAAGIVTGIGFLGAGTIMRARASVLGLTTAASLWGVAGVGLALGVGFYKAAIYAAVAMIITLAVLGWFAKKYMGKGESTLDVEE
ncbi:MAG: MgtC/SapB family protein [Candidatus Omnitrophica bacterium]|nr:MgtC/SapB family protein [Candidatus Omnitrophota bacterium]